MFKFPNCFSGRNATGVIGFWVCSNFFNTSYLYQSHYCNARFVPKISFLNLGGWWRLPIGVIRCVCVRFRMDFEHKTETYVKCGLRSGEWSAFQKCMPPPSTGKERQRGKVRRESELARVRHLWAVIKPDYLLDCACRFRGYAEICAIVEWPSSY